MKLALAITIAATLAAADNVPSWVQEAAKREAPAFPPGVTSVVLFQEEHLTVAPDGQRSVRERGAIRLVQTNSRSIRAYGSYNSKNGRIREIQGWLLAPSGKVTALGKDQTVDQALSQSDAYNEYRAKSLECPAGTAQGTVFAYEIVGEEKSIFTQYYYDFQNRSPVLQSRFVLTLPPGWETKAVTLNRSPVEPTISGTTQTWELANLPWLEDEDYSPSAGSITPRLCVTWFSAAGGVRPLNDWASVSAWQTALVDPPAAVTDAIAAKSAELVANAKTELDKIKAIADFVQATNYISIQMNLNRGGGYTPQAAADILKRNYGDCKDKSTLMRALLKAAGIESYMAVIFSGDRHYVKPEWPSVLPFNHAIVAVRLSDATSVPTGFTHPVLGRLMLFDPTASRTPVGELPISEQGSYALILAGDKGDLVKAPLLPAAANRIESDVEGSLAQGTVFSGKLLRRYFGQSATSMRYRSDDTSELKKGFEREFSRRLGGVTVASVQGQDAADRFDSTVDFTVNQFGQLMQGRLLLIRPGTVAPGNDFGFTAKERKQPIRIFARVRKDRVRIQLPAGFSVDEMPDPVALKGPYGKYNAIWKVDADHLVFEQIVDIADVDAPAAEYDAVRTFFDRIAAGQSSAVVLVRR